MVTAVGIRVNKQLEKIKPTSKQIQYSRLFAFRAGKPPWNQEKTTFNAVFTG
jgi:hypothetical protein